ncbi:SGNH/GDSL hydrolase family protein [Geodermatophilus sp. SYSU D00079]
MTPTRAGRGPSGRRLRLVAVVLGVLLLASCDDRAPEPAGTTTTPPTSPTAAASTPATTAPSTSSAAGSPEAGAPGAAQSEADTGTGAGLRFAVVGDSITAGFAAVLGTTVNDRSSWIPFADEDERVGFAGGYAVPGATTAVMRDGVGPVDADVVVVMGGTNDLREDVPWEAVRDNLLQIVATTDVPTVLLSAVPPQDDHAAGVLELNARLEQLATEQGWQFVDPWSGMSAEGAWVAGGSDDGIHPVEQVVALVGERLAGAIAAAG